MWLPRARTSARARTTAIAIALARAGTRTATAGHGEREGNVGVWVTFLFEGVLLPNLVVLDYLIGVDFHPVKLKVLSDASPDPGIRFGGPRVTRIVLY